MIDLQEQEQGVILPVRAQPGAKKNMIQGTHDGQLKVAVTAPPDQGKANEAIVRLLADQLSISKSSIVLLSGATNRRKKFLIAGLTADSLRQALPLDG
ncbi:MAG: YggU family protein [Planctomycetales bacterium]|nr:YggU family protein [Planctomycetales bacterium]